MVFKKILLAADLTKLDDTLINYLKKFAGTFKPDEIHIVNVLIPLVLPLNIEDDVIEAGKNQEMLKFEDLKRKVREKLKNTARIHFHQLIGNPMSELLKFSHKNKIDLILSGRKRKSHGGVVPERLTRKANCAILLVPEGSKPAFKKIVIPVDFSGHSKLALSTVKNYSSSLVNSKIFCLDVLYYPVYPVKNGHTEKLFKEDRSKNAETEFKKFVGKYEDPDYSMKTFFSFDDYNDPHKLILKFAEDKKADLIIIGSKGLTPAASFLLGSTAEKIIRRNHTIPLLVVKRKNENIGLFKLWFG